jgi:uncharacterized membrane protein YuzA (DUF378 family)
MRITALLAHFFIICGALDTFFHAVVGFFISSAILGAGSGLQKLYFCLVGVSGIFFIFFGLIYKPYKSLSK